MRAAERAEVGERRSVWERESVSGRRTPRVVAARKLQRRRDRDAAGQFLAEGPQAVREAIAAGRRAAVAADKREAVAVGRREGVAADKREGVAGGEEGIAAGGRGEPGGGRGIIRELFVTGAGVERYRDLVDEAAAAGARISPVTDDALESLAETVQPQGLVAVCAQHTVPLEEALVRGPRLVAVLAEIRDPGNAGTVLRTADAAGAGAVVFAGDAVDPYNGKCVRATAGSLFHLDVVRDGDPTAVVTALKQSMTVLAATGYGDTDLDDLADAGGLDAPTAWLFGSEAHGLPADLVAAAHARVRVPLYGRAESLNLAAAAAVCLYASARAHRADARADRAAAQADRASA